MRVEGGTVLIRVVAGSGEGNPDDPYRLTVTSAPAASDAPAPPPAMSADSVPSPREAGEVRPRPIPSPREAGRGLGRGAAVLLAPPSGLAALACAHKPEGPAATLQEFGAALGRGDVPGARTR